MAQSAKKEQADFEAAALEKSVAACLEQVKVMEAELMETSRLRHDLRCQILTQGLLYESNSSNMRNDIEAATSITTCPTTSLQRPFTLEHPIDCYMNCPTFNKCVAVPSSHS